MTDELRLAVQELQMTPGELRNVVIAGFKGSFFPGLPGKNGTTCAASSTGEVLAARYPLT